MKTRPSPGPWLLIREFFRRTFRWSPIRHAAGIDQLLLKLKEAFGITIIVVTHELASAFLIADRMVLLDKGYIVANGRPEELKNSPHPRVRQFLDRIAEPELSQEIDYLQMLTGEVPRPRQ